MVRAWSEEKQPRGVRFFCEARPMCPPDRFGDGRTSESGGGVGVSFLNILATWWYIMSVFVRVQVGAGMSSEVLPVAACEAPVHAMRLFWVLTCEV